MIEKIGVSKERSGTSWCIVFKREWYRWCPMVPMVSDGTIERFSCYHLLSMYTFFMGRICLGSWMENCALKSPTKNSSRLKRSMPAHFGDFNKSQYCTVLLRNVWGVAGNCSTNVM